MIRFLKDSSSGSGVKWSGVERGTVFPRMAYNSDGWGYFTTTTTIYQRTYER